MFSATIYTHCWILKAIRNDAGMQKIAKIPVLYSQPHRGSCIKPSKVRLMWGTNESTRALEMVKHYCCDFTEKC